MIRYLLSLISGRQISAARDLLGNRVWTQTYLAKRAHVAINTIVRMEAAHMEIPVRVSSLRKVRQVLEKAGIVFLNDKQPGVRLVSKPK